MRSKPIPRPTSRSRQGWIRILVALIGATAIVAAAFIKAIPAQSTRDPVPPVTTSPSSPSPSPTRLAPPGGRPRIIAPDDGYQTTEAKLDITADAAEPAPGHEWYLAVQPLRQPGSYYFHKAVPAGNRLYIATVGIGPNGSRGVGTYVVSVVDADATATTAINHEMRSNTAHYNDNGMPLPSGAAVITSIKVLRIG
jgi:hypothetical protein